MKVYSEQNVNILKQNEEKQVEHMVWIRSSVIDGFVMIQKIR